MNRLQRTLTAGLAGIVLGGIGGTVAQKLLRDAQVESGGYNSYRPPIALLTSLAIGTAFGYREAKYGEKKN